MLPHSGAREVPVKISLGPHSKTVAAVIGVALEYATQHYASNPWVGVAVAVAAALGVWAVPNAPKPSPPPSGM
jgi:hypothetical protein